jgi:acylaminoacyl-peptidase
MLGALFLGIALAGAPSNRLAVGDVFNLELASDPQISPDGTRVVYVRRFADIMKDQRRSNLWIVSFDGKDTGP